MNDYFIKSLQAIQNDKEQYSAYMSERDTVVLAGPGSGKTTVLSLKVMKLLSEDIRAPYGLACVTYSREAAREFQTRLKKYGLARKQNVFLGTVHGFCLAEILGPFSELYPKYNIPKKIKIISEKDKKTLFNEVRRQIVGADDLKIEEMDKERTRDIAGLSQVDIPAYDIALKVAYNFESQLQQKDLLDFISIVKFSTLLLQNEDYVRKCIEAKFKWLIIDEYQDLGRPLHEIVLYLLNNTSTKIFAVGDPDQSIYDFQGAAPDYLQELYALMDPTSQIVLKNNYRSSQELVDASTVVLGEKRQYLSKGVYCNFPSKIEFITCDCEMDPQYETAISLAQKYIAEGIAAHEISILVGQNDHIVALSSVCDHYRIPYYVSRYSFVRSDLVKWLECCAEWISSPLSFSFDELFDTWLYFCTQNQVYIKDNEIIFLKRKLYSVLHNASKKETLFDCVSCILEEMEFASVFKDSKLYPDEIDNIEALFSALSEGSLRNYSIDKFAQIGIPKDQIVLSTRHGSKGLEFDVVIMLGMEEGNFPRTYRATNRSIAEARRLCFVCVSRARIHCILIRSKSITIQTRYGPWTKEYEESRFWSELKEHAKKTID